MKCGAQLMDDANVCFSCGQRVSRPPAPIPQIPSPPPVPARPAPRYCVRCGAQLGGGSTCYNCGYTVQRRQPSAAPAGRVDNGSSAYYDRGYTAQRPQPSAAPAGRVDNGSSAYYDRGYTAQRPQPSAAPGGSVGGGPSTYDDRSYKVQEQPASNAPVVQIFTSNAPVGQLKTNRGLFKLILLSLLTFGIYGIVVMSAVSTDINIIADRYDGRKTMHYCLMVFVFSWLTIGIAPIVWYHRISNRIGSELQRRNINYRFSAGTYWGWGVFGILIGVGPFIYMHKMLKSMNLLAANYNVSG